MVQSSSKSGTRSTLDEALSWCSQAGIPTALFSELEADVEVFDHTNVPWASPIPAMLYYPLGLFVSAVSFNAENTG